MTCYTAQSLVLILFLIRPAKNTTAISVTVIVNEAISFVTLSYDEPNGMPEPTFSVTSINKYLPYFGKYSVSSLITTNESSQYPGERLRQRPIQV